MPGGSLIRAPGEIPCKWRNRQRQRVVKVTFVVAERVHSRCENASVSYRKRVDVDVGFTLAGTFSFIVAVRHIAAGNMCSGLIIDHGTAPRHLQRFDACGVVAEALSHPSHLRHK